MNWLNALSSPVANAIYLAGATYAGSVALEKGMRKDALRDIAAFITRSSVVPDLQIVTEFTYREFCLIFGKRHFSFKCMYRSIIASIVTMIAVVWLIYLTEPTGDYKTLVSSVHIFKNDFIGVLLFILILSFLPDYVSLFKGRLLLRHIARWPKTFLILFGWLTDIFLSLVISVMMLLITLIVIKIWSHSTDTTEDVFVTWFFPHSALVRQHL